MSKADWTKRKTFAEAYARSGNGKQAAMEAGVPTGSAAVMASRWLKDAEIAELIRKEMSVLLNESGPLAIATIRQLIEDPNTPAPTRLQACRDILDRSGHIPPKRAEMKVSVYEKKVDELTVEELEAIISET